MFNNTNQASSPPPKPKGEPPEIDIKDSSEDDNEELKQEPKPKETPYNYEELNSGMTF